MGYTNRRATWKICFRSCSASGWCGTFILIRRCSFEWILIFPRRPMPWLRIWGMEQHRPLRYIPSDRWPRSPTELHQQDAYILANLLAKAFTEGHLDILRVTKAYNSVRQPFANSVVDATRQQGNRYDLNVSGFEDVKEGDTISPHQLTELGKSIEKGWEWTWKTSIKDDLERALAKL